MKLFAAMSSVVLFSSLVQARNASSFLKFASDVPREQQSLIKQDLENLSRLQVTQADPNLRAVMDLEGAASGASLLAWISERVHYVLSEDFKLSVDNMSVAQAQFPFQNPGLTPDLPKGGKKADADRNTAGNLVITRMNNTGSALYVAGKQNGSLLAIKFPGKFGKLSVPSPRTGIIQIGKGLFANRKGDTRNPQDIDRSFERLGTFFHEARHSDGNGKTLGLVHALCPAGHAYAGFSACDFSLNGSYGVEAAVGKVLFENCSECSVAQKESLRLNYLDSVSRVILEKTVEEESSPMDATIADAYRKLCEVQTQYKMPMAPECASLDRDASAKPATKTIMKAQYLNSRPEGL
ncbi:MAG: hypothetical protein EOP06_12860 [Proteobacteria bacterium]|nr:MAG: hypothetical protein EOP06_12860 [Pseudomonadota bacterium]